METQLSDERPCVLPVPETPPALSAVVLYEDVPAGQRAVQALRHLVEDDGGPTVVVQPQLWRFDWLVDSEWFALALADALNADLLVVSTSSASGLPATIGGWLKLCLARKRGTNGAVVALIEAEGPDSPPLQLVRGLAHAAGLDFFAPFMARDPEVKRCVESHEQETRGEQILPPQIARQPSLRVIRLGEIHPYQRWGLNE